MKIKSITVKNIGIIADVTIPFNKPLIIFYGDIRQGKTTLLNGVKWGLGAKFPQDIIRHGADTGHIRLDFEDAKGDGHISREFTVKDGVTKAKLYFVQNGQPINRPAEAIDKLLNPFTLDQDFLRDMNETDRRQYFIDLFDVDTSKLDKEFDKAAADATALRATIKAYGDIDVTPVEPVDVAALKKQRAAIINDHKNNYLAGINQQIHDLEATHTEALAEIDAQNEEIREANTALDNALTLQDDTRNEIANLERELKEAKAKLESTTAWIKKNPRKEEIPRPTAPDTTELRAKLSVQPNTTSLDKKIAEAAAVQVRVDQYAENLRRATVRDRDKDRLRELEARQKEIKAEKAEKLQSVSKSCGIKGLSFDENGGVIYNGTAAGMLSTSQIMTLSVELSNLYPPGFGLDLIDRCESLGKSVFTLVGRAKRTSRTILATVVGDRPTVVPEEIGVFIVENGNFTPSPEKPKK